MARSAGLDSARTDSERSLVTLHRQHRPHADSTENSTVRIDPPLRQTSKVNQRAKPADLNSTASPGPTADPPAHRTNRSPYDLLVPVAGNDTP